MTAPRLALLYLVFMLPLVLGLSWYVPPFQVADEDNHFLRAVQVAGGGMAALRLPDGTIGGRLPTGAEQLAHGFEDLRFRRRARIDPGRITSAGRVGWGAPGVSSFANTAIYPPLFYAPAAAGILVGRALGANVLASFRLARAGTGLCATALAAAAIGMTASGALLLFWLLSLPMTLCLFASCSQDALVIACAAFAAAWMSRLAQRPRTSVFSWATLALLIGCLGAAKLPYMGLGLLPAMSAWRGGIGIARAVLLALLSFCVGLSWLVLAARPVIAPTSAGLQMHFLLSHPFVILPIALVTLHLHGFRLVQEFIGVLGWLDIPLPRLFYAGSLLVLCLLLGMEGIVRHYGRVAAVMALILLACCAAVFGALYLDWTPVGGHTVEGLQGRYFIPLALFAAPLLSRRNHYPLPVLPVLGAWALTSMLVVIMAVHAHYIASVLR